MQQPRKRPRRAHQACARCRKQKLRCDNERPCALCVRSNAECRDCPVERRKENRSGSDQDLVPSRLPGQRTITQSPTATIFQTAVRSGEQQQAINATWKTPPAGCSEPSSDHQERTSTYGLVDHLFQKYDATSRVAAATNAIPGGSPNEKPSRWTNEPGVPISLLIGRELPSQEVTDLLFETYFRSFHWFMLVCHEPSLRAEFERLRVTGCISPHRLPFLVLVLAVLAIGTVYTTEAAAQARCPGLDLQSLRSEIMTLIEEKFFALFDQENIESIQVCILIGAIYLFHGQPKRAFMVLGAAWKGAQALNLNRESAWTNLDQITRQVWRRVWLAVYIYDGYAAICYGRACTIREEDWKVEMPRNLDDTSAVCPGFASFEAFEDGSHASVTILTYQRLRFKLYRIAAPITRNVYFQSGMTAHQIIERIETIHQHLSEWQKAVPAELRLQSFSDHLDELDHVPIMKTFYLQALALQLLYDNVQIILHRPLLTCNLTEQNFYMPQNNMPEEQSRVASERNDNTSPGWHRQWILKTLESSRRQCWKSAIRTSYIGEHSAALRACRHSPLASYAGVQTFTAGVMLGIFALSDPLSTDAQTAKRAISRLIKLPRALSFQTAMSDQGGNVLEELLKLILTQEMKKLVANEEMNFVGGLSAEGSRLTGPTTPLDSPATGGASYKESGSWPGNGSGMVGGSGDRRCQHSTARMGSCPQCIQLQSHHPKNEGDLNVDFMSIDQYNWEPESSTELVPSLGDFGEAFASIQGNFWGRAGSGGGYEPNSSAQAWMWGDLFQRC